jgi:hypothetical protein
MTDINLPGIRQRPSLPHCLPHRESAQAHALKKQQSDGLKNSVKTSKELYESARASCRERLIAQ